MTFADRLAELMAERGVGVLALARAVPCDQAHVSRMVHGQRVPSLDLARRLDGILETGGELAALCENERRPQGDSVPPAAAGEVRETSQMLIAMERRLGGDVVLPAAVQAFRVASGDAGDDHDRLAAAGEAAEVASWISYDAGNMQLSRRLASDGITLSREAGDLDMEMFLANNLCMLSIDEHRPAAALRIADAALVRRLSPRAEAIFRVRRGRALVQLGRATDGLAELARARAIVTSGPVSRDPCWTWWLDESEVNWQEGTARAELGDWRNAIPMLAEALRQRESGHGVRTIHHDRACLLGALVRAGAYQDTGQLLADLRTSAMLIRSGRTTALLRHIAASATLHAPEGLDDEIRALVAA